MRNLTIMRAKSVVACAATMKVYIEDPMCDDLTINGLPCRFLGKLKNGEVKTFQIDESAAKVFVIADNSIQVSVAIFAGFNKFYFVSVFVEYFYIKTERLKFF